MASGNSCWRRKVSHFNEPVTPAIIGVTVCLCKDFFFLHGTGINAGEKKKLYLQKSRFILKSSFR